MAFEAGMAHAFEVTGEDVRIAMANAGVEVPLDEAERILAEHVAPRMDEAAAAALAGDGLEEQAEAAQAFVGALLAERGVLPSSPTP